MEEYGGSLGYRVEGQGSRVLGETVQNLEKGEGSSRMRASLNLPLWLLRVSNCELKAGNCRSRRAEVAFLPCSVAVRGEKWMPPLLSVAMSSVERGHWSSSGCEGRTCWRWSAPNGGRLLLCGAESWCCSAQGERGAIQERAQARPGCQDGLPLSTLLAQTRTQLVKHATP